MKLPAAIEIDLGRLVPAIADSFGHVRVGITRDGQLVRSEIVGNVWAMLREERARFLDPDECSTAEHIDEGELVTLAAIEFRDHLTNGGQVQ